MPKTFDEFMLDFGKPKDWKDRAVNGWNRAKKKVSDGVKWIADNPQEATVVVTIVTSVGAVLKKGFKTVDKFVTAKRETYNKERYVYDHSAGRYLKTSKVLSGDDLARIEELRRKNPGMKKAEAMAKLKLLD